MAEQGNLKEFFNLGTMSEEELGMIEFVLNSPAYTESFKPYLVNMRDSMQKLWLDRSEDRKRQYPDDFLAGGVAAIDGLIALFDKLILETRMDRIHESMAVMTPEVQYDAMRRRGGMKPVLGPDQPAVPEDYDPASDF